MKLHLAKIDRYTGKAYRACDRIFKPPYTLLVSAVTCKRCEKIKYNMNDNEWKEKIKSISDPLEMLKVIFDNEQFFGYDSYYSDLRSTMLDQAEVIIRKGNKE